MTMTLASIQAMPRIGYGNFRNVYSDGTYVYKVEYGEGIDLECNRNEYANFLSLNTADLPANVVIPEMVLFTVDGVQVIRMPYVAGTLMGDCYCLADEFHGDDCLPDDIVSSLFALGIDCAYGNVIESGGTYYVVDLDADLR